MTVVVNGKPVELPEGTTVRVLLDEHLGLAGQACAVEVNRALVRRLLHESTRLNPEDQVEVVTLVGGG
jgi:thiamine biosynthesis protein ThiS